MPSLAVARAGHSALKRGAHLKVTGLPNRLLAFSVRFVPIRTATGVARRLFEEV
jgi:hypothetical protein